MHTIVLATQKGGSGKSTLAIGLAVAAQQAGHNVRLIETDPQATLSSWQARRGIAEPLVETILQAGDIETRLAALERGGVTLAIIDTAGGASAATTVAIRHGDFCLIPARPSIADVEASAATVVAAKAWKTPFAFVLNQTPIRGQRVGTAATSLCERAARELADVVAPACIAMRNDHQDALAAGLAVSEFAPWGKSADEIRLLWQWVDARLNSRIARNAETRVDISDLHFPFLLAPDRRLASAKATMEPPLPALRESLSAWDTVL
jgi:chromosome partitioning protein